MSRCDGAPPVGDAPSMRGSPTRRRLLALLSSLPIIAIQSSGAEQRRASQADHVANADPMPRLFAEFQALLDRHTAAIVTRDGIEAALVSRIGWPRVALPGGSDSEARYAAELTPRCYTRPAQANTNANYSRHLTCSLAVTFSSDSATCTAEHVQFCCIFANFTWGADVEKFQA